MYVLGHPSHSFTATLSPCPSTLLDRGLPHHSQSSLPQISKRAIGKKGFEIEWSREGW